MSAAIAKRMNSAPPAISVYTGAWWASGMGGGVGGGASRVWSARPCRAPPPLNFRGVAQVRRGADAVQVRCTGRRTIRSEIRLASSLPPMTAMPVQMAWPMIAPRVTPKGSLAAACIVDHAMKCAVHCHVVRCARWRRGAPRRPPCTACTDGMWMTPFTRCLRAVYASLHTARAPARLWRSESDLPTRRGR